MDYNDKINLISEKLQGPKYKDLPLAQVKTSLADFLSRQYRRKGQTVGESSLLETIDLLDEDISRYYGGTATYSEVELAIDWGLHGEYGEFTGMNADRLFRFVRNYMESQERTEGKRRANVMSQQPVPQEVDIPRKNWEVYSWKTRSLWQEYLETGTVFLNDTGLFDLGRIRVHVADNCCHWLILSGIVSDDDTTGALRRKAEKNSSTLLKRLSQNRGAAYDSLKSVATNAMMLQMIFSAMKSSGYDLAGEIDAIRSSTPESERIFY